MSLIAVAVALLVLVLLELVPGAVVPDAAWLNAPAPVTLFVPLTALFVVDPGDSEVVLPVPLTATLALGAAVSVPAPVVGLLPAPATVPPLAVTLPCAGAVVPEALSPDPLTVEAFTVVEPDAYTSPAPLFDALTVVEPAASVAALLEPLGNAAVVGGALPALVPAGAAVPLAAIPDPLTVAAFTVVEPEASSWPEPLFVALTVVEPAASVVAFG